MPLHHAVLALLSAKPAHGYELKSSFEQAVGDQWGGLNIGHLYQILERLSRDGLVDSQRQSQQVKPDRLVYHLTPAGRTELDRWLGEPAVSTRGYRDDFFLKVMAAARSADPAALPAVLSRQRAHLLRQLHALASARIPANNAPARGATPNGVTPSGATPSGATPSGATPSGATPSGSTASDASASTAVESLLITAAELHIRADLGVIDAAEKTLTAAPATGQSAPRMAPPQSAAG